jgi:hypothetical protein
MRFLGGKRGLKNNGKDNGNEISRLAPAFGSAVGPIWLVLFQHLLKACPSGAAAGRNVVL